MLCHTQEEQAGGHMIKHCLFSCHEECGIVLGNMDDPHRVLNAHLDHVIAGADCTAKKPLPNGMHGICIMYAENTYLMDVISCYNAVNGLYQSIKSFGTNAPVIDVSYNLVGAVCIEGPPNLPGLFEGELVKTRIHGNGNNAITTPCGQIKEL